MDFKTNYFRLKHLEVKLRKIDSSEVIPRTINFDASNGLIDQITHLGKRIIMLKSDRVFGTYFF